MKSYGIHGVRQKTIVITNLPLCSILEYNFLEGGTRALQMSTAYIYDPLHDTCSLLSVQMKEWLNNKIYDKGIRIVLLTRITKDSFTAHWCLDQLRFLVDSKKQFPSTFEHLRNQRFLQMLLTIDVIRKELCYNLIWSIVLCQLYLKCTSAGQYHLGFLWWNTGSQNLYRV